VRAAAGWLQQALRHTDTRAKLESELVGGARGPLRPLNACRVLHADSMPHTRLAPCSALCFCNVALEVPVHFECKLTSLQAKHSCAWGPLLFCTPCSIALAVRHCSARSGCQPFLQACMAAVWHAAL
jgi:hypothetical protein